METLRIDTDSEYVPTTHWQLIGVWRSLISGGFHVRTQYGRPQIAHRFSMHVHMLLRGMRN